MDIAKKFMLTDLIYDFIEADLEEERVEEYVKSLSAFFNDNDELIADIIKNERMFNRYEYCFDWDDLAHEILSDEAFISDEDSNDYLKTISNAINNGEEAIKQLLISHNWAIDTDTGIAIGFDKDIKVFNHEV